MTTQRHEFDAAPFLLEELPPVARCSLRLRPDNRAALAAVLGLDLPAAVGQRSRTAQAEVLCMGPDEWTIVTGDDGRDRLVAAAAEARDRLPHSLCDISDREVTLRLSGPQALTALTTGCPRDLDSIPVGHGARTLFDAATVVLWRDGPQEVRMDVWRSFLPHVRAIFDKVFAELKSGL